MVGRTGDAEPVSSSGSSRVQSRQNGRPFVSAQKSPRSRSRGNLASSGGSETAYDTDGVPRGKRAVGGGTGGVPLDTRPPLSWDALLKQQQQRPQDEQHDLQPERSREEGGVDFPGGRVAAEHRFASVDADADRLSPHSGVDDGLYTPRLLEDDADAAPQRAHAEIQSFEHFDVRTDRNGSSPNNASDLVEHADENALDEEEADANEEEVENEEELQKQRQRQLSSDVAAAAGGSARTRVPSARSTRARALLTEPPGASAGFAPAPTTLLTPDPRENNIDTLMQRSDIDDDRDRVATAASSGLHDCVHVNTSLLGLLDDGDGGRAAPRLGSLAPPPKTTKAASSMGEAEPSVAASRAQNAKNGSKDCTDKKQRRPFPEAVVPRQRLTKPSYAAPPHPTAKPVDHPRPPFPQPATYPIPIPEAGGSVFSPSDIDSYGYKADFPYGHNGARTLGEFNAPDMLHYAMAAPQIEPSPKRFFPVALSPLSHHPPLRPSAQPLWSSLARDPALPPAAAVAHYYPYPLSQSSPACHLRAPAQPLPPVQPLVARSPHYTPASPAFSADAYIPIRLPMPVNHLGESTFIPLSAHMQHPHLPTNGRTAAPRYVASLARPVDARRMVLPCPVQPSSHLQPSPHVVLPRDRRAQSAHYLQPNTYELVDAECCGLDGYGGNDGEIGRNCNGGGQVNYKPYTLQDYKVLTSLPTEMGKLGPNLNREDLIEQVGPSLVLRVTLRTCLVPPLSLVASQNGIFFSGNDRMQYGCTPTISESKTPNE